MVTVVAGLAAHCICFFLSDLHTKWHTISIQTIVLPVRDYSNRVESYAVYVLWLLGSWL